MNQKIGTVVFDLAPSAGNPRNSEGAFLNLKDGRILFAYSRYTGDSGNDDAAACIAGRWSNDDGRTWSDEQVLASPDEHQAMNIMSVSLMRMANGDIGLFYLIRHGWHDTRLHLRRSSDEGKTWGEAICCLPAPGYFVTNNDRVIRLSSGRLLVPAAYHRMRGESKTHWHSFDSRGTGYFFYSDDDGKTWQEARNPVVLDEPGTRRGLLEPGVIELKDGTIWSWHRTDLGRQYESFSLDGGETWSKPSVSVFSSPDSPLSMKRLPSGELFAVWNPIPNYQTRNPAPMTNGRTPLVGSISKDEGKTWGNWLYFETEEDKNGCCYTAIYFTEEAMLLGYCAGTEADNGCFNRLRIRRIEWKELQSVYPELQLA